jgi:hypothetical protein
MARARELFRSSFRVLRIDRALSSGMMLPCKFAGDSAIAATRQAL